MLAPAKRRLPLHLRIIEHLVHMPQIPVPIKVHRMRGRRPLSARSVSILSARTSQ
jgi:hypothetical protein